MDTEEKSKSAGRRSRGDYICPACRSEVLLRANAYVCEICEREFPILFNIPDFRLAADAYLTLSEERKKAGVLYRYGQNHSFTELVNEYYRLTHDIPEDMVERFSNYIHSGPARGEIALGALHLQPKSSIIDLGCATGGFLISAKREGHCAVGVDIALRWLIICAKRLEEAGLDMELVCADVEALPFYDESFDAAVASDLFEHVSGIGSAFASINRVMKHDARIFITGVNRFTLTPFPLAGLWGVGYLPASMRRQYVKARRGIDTLRYANLFSSYSLARAAKQKGFECGQTNPLKGAKDAADRDRGVKRAMMLIYDKLRCWPITRRILVTVGPAFEFVASKQ